MELSPEDSLRLNVMLANKPQAIRINESRMVVYALSEKGEMEILLNPTCRDEQYLKQIREMLSMHVLGSPSGYPKHIWSRMGHLSNGNLEDLLLLGEPEAVVAVAYSSELTDELAYKVWWALEDAENARQMLRMPAIVNGKMGPKLAAYLVEFLPFETEAEKIMDTVRLVLQSGLLDDAVVQDLWKRGRRKNAFYVGFLATLPDALPGNASANNLLQPLAVDLQQMAVGCNKLAGLLERVLSASGQTWLATLKQVLEKPGNQDVVNWSLDVAADYFSAARPQGKVDATIEELDAEARAWVEEPGNVLVQQILDLDPQLDGKLHALRVLSGSGYGIVRPVFGKTDAIGTLMRRKLQPVLEPYLEYVKLLQE
ncbi:MAG TPA: sulfur reduction protein DsrS [Thiolapillus brandeum]|uniref:Sulfur reduction protein DsrS n=1 Tax=Thiolapillus brandeum TaxID=1076588 RepID=A0A831K205_9GAMM|nr:sulfur reduction protein DsrS [Thiolapillus brandeum]